MDPTVVLIIAATVVVDIIIVIVVLRAKKAKREKLRQLVNATVEAEGWQSLPPTASDQLYRFQGTIASGISWELTARSNGRSSRRSYSSSRASYRPTLQAITWETKDIRLEGKVIGLGTGGGLGMQLTDVDMGHALIQSALKRIYGDDLASKLAETTIVQLPERTIPRLYMLLSTDPDLAEKFVRDPVASILRDWQGEKMPIPNILLWDGGMRVRFMKVQEDVELLRKIVLLCGTLAIRGKEIEEEAKRT